MLQKLFQAMSTPSLLAEATTEAAPEIQGPGVCNFIGMEYYAGILNRIYFVCAGPEVISYLSNEIAFNSAKVLSSRIVNTSSTPEDSLSLPSIASQTRTASAATPTTFRW